MSSILKDTTTAASTVDLNHDNEDYVHEIPLDTAAVEDDATAPPGSRDSPLNMFTDKMKDYVNEESKTIQKLTRLNLAGIATRQATSRWNDIVGTKKSSSPNNNNDTAALPPTAPPVFIVDVRNWRCITVSVLMTILFYLLCVGSILVIVLIFFWWWFVWRPENGESLVNQTTIVDDPF
jgi:hypothetical protein